MERRQTFNFNQKINRIINNRNLKEHSCFIGVKTPYRIKIPNLTNKEVDWVNKNFDSEEELISSKIVKKDDLNKYKKTYKYLPNYYDVRM